MSKSLRGSLSVVDSLTDTSVTKALSAGRGKELQESLRDKGLPAWTYFYNPRLFTPAADTPYLRGDQDHSTLSASNWPDLVPLLTGFDYVSGSTSVFTATPSIGADPELILTNNADHTGLIRDLLEDVRFFNWVEASNDIAAFDDTVFANYELVLEIVSSSVAGLVAGSKYRIKYVSSLANTLDVAARRIRISATTSGGASAITFKIKPFLRLSDANARWRKIDDAVIQSGFSGLRRLDQGQGHQHQYGGEVIAMAGGGSAFLANYSSAYGGNPTGNMVSAGGSSGNVRSGNKGRPRAGGAYLYILGGRYVA
jgi:hypothetical protein